MPSQLRCRRCIVITFILFILLLGMLHSIEYKYGRLQSFKFSSFKESDTNSIELSRTTETPSHHSSPTLSTAPTTPLIKGTKNIFQTHYKIDSELNKLIDQWRSLNHDWAHIFTNDLINLQFVQKHFPEYLELYTGLPENIQRADLWRYLILLGEGGVYTDADTVPKMPIRQWPEYAKTFLPQQTLEKYDFVNVESVVIAGIEAVVDSEAERIRLLFARQVQIVQWTLYSGRPGHQVFRDVAEKILKKWLKDKANPIDDPKTNNFRILDSTGPGIWTDAVVEYLQGKYRMSSPRVLVQGRCYGYESDDGKEYILDLCVLPINAFGSGVPHSGAGSHNGDDVLAWHLYRGSWREKGNPVKGEDYVKLNSH